MKPLPWHILWRSALRRLSLLALVGGLPVAADAATYALPDTLPSGCTRNSATRITCASLSLGWNDSIVVGNANTTLAVTGTFTANGNSINIASPASGFILTAEKVSGSNFLNFNGSLNATKSLSLGSNSNAITGNVVVDGDASIGGRITGTLTADGSLTTQWATSIGGDVSADSIGSGGGNTWGGSLTATGRDISLGAGDQVSGSLSSARGKVSTSSNVTIGGGVSAQEDVSLASGTSVGGSVSSSNEDVTLKSSGTKVGGNVSAKGKITLESGAAVTGNVASSNDEVILKSAGSSVGGSVSAKKSVTLESGTSVGGDVTSEIDEVRLKSSSASVGGNVTAKKEVILESGTQVKGKLTSTGGDVELKSSGAVVGQCLTVDKSRKITLGWGASVAGVCCLSGSTCGTACVDNKSGKATPAACVATPESSCQADAFTSLDSSRWSVSGVGYTPQVVGSPSVPSSRLRLTDNAANRATFAQFRKWFPGVGNKIVVEFDYYGWGGSGADGIAMVLSDASVAPGPGGYGGSLGYASRSGIDGFGGGWLGVGLDEYGNFPGTGEGRRGYPGGYSPPGGAGVAAGVYKNSIAVRGSGTAQSGYYLLANSGTLTTAITTTNTTPHRYRVTLDHSNNLNAWLSVERNSGSGYVTVIPAFDVKGSSSGQAAVPENLLLSFTGSTGGATNYHEIANVQVCASKIVDVGDGAAAENFECMDGALSQAQYNNLKTSPSSRNPIYTKLVNGAFNLRVVPLATDGNFKSDYLPAGSSRDVTVEFFDDSATPQPACAAYGSSTRVASQTASLVSGVLTTGNFSLTRAYAKLRCRVTDKTVAASPVYGCSSDLFSVRPGSVALSMSPVMAAPPSASAAATLKAGASFTLQVATSTAASDGYGGTLSLDSTKLTAQNTAQDGTVEAGGVVGALSPASLVANATPSNNASYTEVGYLYLAAGAYRDASFTAVDQVGDCVAGSTSVSLSGGKYGCWIGTTASASLGRFIPDHFAVSSASLAHACAAGGFSYMGQDFSTAFTLEARGVGEGLTKNYAGSFARLALGSWASFGFASPDATLVQGTAATTASPWSAGSTGVIAWHAFNRPASASAPLNAGVTASPVDDDNVVLAGSNTVAAGVNAADGVAAFRYGRLQVFNAFGSDQSSLSVPLQARYWSGKSWIPNGRDSCTSVPAAAVALSGHTGTLAGANMSTAGNVNRPGGGSTTLSNGSGSIVLKCPYGSCPTSTKPAQAYTGTVDMALNLGSGTADVSCLAAHPATTGANLGWLRYGSGACGGQDPSARASFGIYAPETRKTVHVREVY